MSTRNYWEQWNEISHKVEKEFLELTAPDRVAGAMRLLHLWMREKLFQPQWGPILSFIRTGNYPLLLDSFYQFIPFGTGGRRGRVGFGPNRINEATVALSVQGHCNYLLNKRTDKDSELSVIIAYDVRIFKDISSTYSFLEDNPLLNLSSQKLAKIACEIYAGCGVYCYISQPEDGEGYLSTPELSFLIRQLGACGGINVSASHNHPDDNGYKFFNAEGAQDIPPYDEELASFMNHVGEVTRMPFKEGMQKGLVKAIPAGLHSEYIETNLHIRRASKTHTSVNPPPVVFTPLCGTGTTTVATVLRAAGYKVIEHEPQSKFDGTFESVPLRLPNPEIPQAAWPAIQTADKYAAPVVLSTDPDADRLGVLAKGSDGGWVHLNGNEIASCLAYYLILDKERGPNRKGLVITTLVTTGMIERIASLGHCESVCDLYVGFKFIAHVLHSLETDGHYNDIKAKADELVLAAEESHGFLLTPKIRDKDAAGASLVLCDLIAALQREGRTILDYLDEIALKCGNFGNDARAILMRGIAGADALNRLMDSLRSSPPESVGKRRIIEFKDYLYDVNGQPRFDPESSQGKTSNLLLLLFEKARIIVRPSGTEPKVKIYAEVEAPGSTRHVAKQQAWELATQMYKECLHLLGPEYKLSASAELIPDHVEMKLKRAFDTDFAPEFISQAPSLAAMDKDALLDWLRLRLKNYGQGSDPLQSMRPALIALCLSAKAKKDEAGQESLSLIAQRLEVTG